MSQPCVLERIGENRHRGEVTRFLPATFREHQASSRIRKYSNLRYERASQQWPWLLV